MKAYGPALALDLNAIAKALEWHFSNPSKKRR